MIPKKIKIALIIPTWNASQYIAPLFASITKQTLKPDTILVIDSSSSDDTQKQLANFAVILHVIAKNEFDHGGTRQLATELVAADVYVFITQDAVLATEESLQNLVAALFSPSNVGCAYGRQLPHPQATPLSAHLRQFNYPETSQVKSIRDISRYGIKTCFNSNSFAAYKQSALKAVGGFPNPMVLGEDVVVAAKLLQHEYQIHYAANAIVYHSHNFTPLQEFRRYFSIGLFHRQESWIIEQFKAPTGEGLRYIHAEINYLAKHNKRLWLPYACLTWMAKFLGYRLGWYGLCLPDSIQRWLKY